MRPFLSTEEAGALLEQLRGLRPEGYVGPGGYAGPASGPTYHCTRFDNDLGYRRRIQALLTRTLLPRAMPMLADYTLLNTSLFVKPPGTGEVAVHQNWTCLEDPDETSVTIWVPLIDVDESNGTMQVVEGSHKLSPSVFSEGIPPYFHGLETVLTKEFLRPLTVRAGEAVLFDDTLIHYTGVNRSSVPRFAVQLIMVPAGSKPVLYRGRPENPGRFEVFALSPEFFVENSIGVIRTDRLRLPLLGLVPDRSSRVTEAEFRTMLQEARESRAIL